MFLVRMVTKKSENDSSLCLSEDSGKLESVFGSVVVGLRAYWLTSGGCSAFYSLILHFCRISINCFQ